MTIQTIAEAEEALQPYVPLVSQLTGKDTTLERIVPLMELLGNPQDKLRVIHIAGTSGKTSTAYYMAALLQANGSYVGLTVSPHVDSITERVQIDGQPISDSLFCNELTSFLDIIEHVKQPPSYFELLYAFALWFFERQAVDFAVVETGMGGLYDATNVVTRADKLCIITDIGYDHMSILGHTLPEITTQKIGIVHDYNPIIMYKQSAEIMNVVNDWVMSHDAHLYVTTEVAERENYSSILEPIAAYQQRNWLLAYTAYRFLVDLGDARELTSGLLQATQQLQVPARMDVVNVQGKTLVMDGAHNAQKMETFIRSFHALYPESKPAVMIALKQGKEYTELAPLLAAFASQIIVTTFHTSQDLPARSIDPTLLANACRAAGISDCTVVSDQHQAYAALVKAPVQHLVMTGSFYLLSQVRNNEHII